MSPWNLLACQLTDGRVLEIYEPVGPGLCERCGSRPEDVCFRVLVEQEVLFDGALCADCFVATVRPSSTGRDSATAA